MTQEPFGDIPLFREIQRILAAGEGPVNLEIARQVATAIATQGAPEPGAPAWAAEALGAVRPAELLVAGYTRLEPDEPARASVIGRSEWIMATLQGWGWLFEHMSRSFVGQIGKLAGEADESAARMQSALGPAAPLLLGLQVGTLVGHLATEAVGRYDPPLPRDDDGHLMLVAPNIEAVAVDYGIGPSELGRWTALQEVARHLVMTHSSWIKPYWRSLAAEILDTIEIDLADLERRLSELQSGGMESLQGGLGDQSLPVVQTERHSGAIKRWNAFYAVYEGYAAHACGAVAAEVLPGHARIDEGMRRRERSPGEGRKILTGMLGIGLDPDLATAGATFCAAVTKTRGIERLNRVWEAPDNLPTLAEIKDPFAWMERVLGEG